MRTLSIIGLLIILMAGKPDTTEKWVVLKGCTLKVEGSTNVSHFTCSVADYATPDTLFFFRTTDKDVPLKGCLRLPVNGFDCLNRTMTADLRKTLKSDDYPHMRIRFLSLQKYPALKPNQEDITGLVCIELAGTARTMEINYHISMDEQQVVHLTGEQQINFSDFNLDPPRKLGGMIRANDKLTVAFQINFRVIKT